MAGTGTGRRWYDIAGEEHEAVGAPGAPAQLPRGDGDGDGDEDA